MMNFIGRISAALCTALLAFSSVTSAFAYGSYTLTDDAMLFDAAQTQKLEDMMQNLGEKTGWEIVVYTNSNYVDADDMEYYYNDYYDSEDFSDDCVMLVFDTGYDNRIINTYGDAMYYFSDERMDEIKSDMKPYLDSRDWYSATVQFLETTEDYFEQGKPDGDSFSNIEINESEKKAENPLLYVLSEYWIIFIVISLVAGASSVVFVYLRYKNHGKQGTYDLKSNSVTNLTQKDDVFLYKNVTVVNESTRSGGSSGGSNRGSSHGSSGSF